MKNIIYALCEPNTETIRYIGKSSTGLKRIKDHLKMSEYTKNTHKSKWIYSLIKKGQTPTVIVLDTTNDPSALSNLEMSYIKAYKELGYNLTNATDGGEGSIGWKPTADNIENMRLGRKAYLETLTEPLKAWNKKEHIIVDGVENKQCTSCEKTLPLTAFGKYKSTWDGLNRRCKECHNNSVNDVRRANAVHLSDEEWKQSYINRKDNMSAGMKKVMAERPELKQQISEKKNKAIKAVNVNTGEVLKFKSGLQAKESGFNNTNLGQAIKFNKPYKGYMWSFDQD